MSTDTTVLCPDGSECEDVVECGAEERCKRIVCWECPYAEYCKNDQDPMIRSCYGDPYNCDVTPGTDCLAAK